MRQPDRPEPGTFRADRDSLAERLSRLPDGHPSSPAGGWPDGGPGEAGYPPDPAGTGREGEEPDQGEGGQHARGDGRAAGAHPVAGGLPDRAGSGGGSYWPWFADGGPAEPWFAAEPGGLPASPDG